MLDKRYARGLVDGRIVTVADATAWLRQVTRAVGPGFHPDTPFEAYVLADGRRAFSPAKAAALQAQLDRACDAFEAAGLDPCAVCLPIQRRLLAETG